MTQGGTAVLCLFLAIASIANASLRIGAFNIKWLTLSKVNDPEVLNVLKQILPRYDIVLIQEVRGDSDAVAEKLVRELNSLQRDVTDMYASVVSSKVGRTNYKEQYIYIYRFNLVSIRSAHQYDDGPEELGTDLFEREPYILVLHSDYTRVKDFAIVGLHAKPDDVTLELNNLIKVVQDTLAEFDIDNILIAGDLNADGGYLSQEEQNALNLTTDPSYTWLIDRGSDTTVGDNTYAYDRFITKGYRMKRYLVSESVTVFNFQDELNLTKEQAMAVSDHYPIEMEIE